MNIKHTFVTLASLAAIGFMASLVQAQTYPIQQRQYQIQQGQYPIQQGQYPVQQGRIIQGNVIQGNVIQGNVIPGQAKQVPTYSNITLTEEQRSKPSIGATLYDAGSSIAVRSTFTNGPAQQAGLKSGDLVTQINGKPADGVAAFNAMIAGMKSGETIKFTKRSKLGKESEAEMKLMTMGEIIKASIVPEAGAYDGVLRQTEIGISKLKQQIKNTEEDLTDLKKQLTTQEKTLADMKVKAEQAAKDAAKLKMENDAKRAAELERLKKAQAASAEAAADAAIKRSSN